MAFQLLVKSQTEGVQLDLKELMGYQLKPVLVCIGTADSLLAKTNKASDVTHLTKDTHGAAAQSAKGDIEYR